MYRRIALFAISAVAISASAFAQTSATASATASARVLTPIAIAKLTDLNFGSLVAGATAGTVVLAPSTTAPARTPSGGVTLANSAFSAASFSVTGEPSMTYTITLPAGAIPITHTTNNTLSMTVNNFTSTPASGTLSAAGAQQVDVGATLNVAANQASGLYSGTFNVSVAY